MSVAVVSYNARDDLRACLGSVHLAASPPPSTVVVDNGSSDGTAEMVRGEFPGVDLVIDPSNRGYGAASNQAVARTATPYVLLVNGDTLVAPGALDALADYLDAHPRVGVLGPRLRNADGTLQPSCYPFLGTVQSWLEKTALGRAAARVPGLRDRVLLVNSGHDRARAVPWVMGAALALRREAFDAIGGFDESFFMYAEEVDLCRRLRNAGWEVHFAPVTDVVHRGGASTAPIRGAMALERVRSATRFYRRHYSPPRAAALIVGIRGAMLLRWLRDGVRLRLAADPAARGRLAEDVAVWRRVVRAPEADALSPVGRAAFPR
ncbi:MAG TPA: glycosyltransferase family 2 protein [Gemmatimonadales bacterium]|nr:glycosyltransferase family 2 protein [Gemmatimonadales bacterium]